MNERSPRTLDRPLSPLLVGLAALAVIAAAVLGWRAVSGGASSAGAPGKDLPVHAGMYDLRAEIQKGRKP